MVTEARVTECRNELVRASAVTLRITMTHKVTVSFYLLPTHNSTTATHSACSQGRKVKPSLSTTRPESSENTQSSSGSTKRSPRQISPWLGVILIRSSRSPWFEDRAGCKYLRIHSSRASIHVRPTSGGSRRNVWIHIVIPRALGTPRQGRKRKLTNIRFGDVPVLTIQYQNYEITSADAASILR